MGCGGSKPLSAAEQRAAALKAAMKKAEKDQNARLDRRESLADEARRDAIKEDDLTTIQTAYYETHTQEKHKSCFVL